MSTASAQTEPPAARPLKWVHGVQLHDGEQLLAHYADGDIEPLCWDERIGEIVGFGEREPEHVVALDWQTGAARCLTRRFQSELDDARRESGEADDHLLAYAGAR